MKYQIGEQVKLLDSRELAQVVQVYADGRILLRLTEDGLEFEADASEIVSLRIDEHIKTKTNPTLVAQQAQLRAQLATGVYMAIEQPAATRIDLHLVNSSDYEVAYAVHRPEAGLRKGLLSGVLLPYQTQLLFNTNTEQLPVYSDLVVELLFFSATAHEPVPPLQLLPKLRNKTLLLPKQTHPVLGREMILLPLWQPMPVAQSAVAAAFKQEQASKAAAVPEVVDLHIEKLTDQHQQLTSAEMLELQLVTFERLLSQAIAAGMRQIIFIHGHGKGRLRDEMHKRLRSMPHIRGFEVDASPKYGYGATRVLI